MPITVATFNMRTNTLIDGVNAWPFRVKRVVRAIDRIAPDLLGTQEMVPGMIRTLRQRLPGFVSFGEGRRGWWGGEHCAIWARVSRMERLQGGTFWLSPAPQKPGSSGWDGAVPRICTWGEWRDRASGSRIRLYNTHLDHKGSTARLEGVKLISSMIAEHRRREPLPYVLCGDFNADPSSAPIRYLLRGAKEEMDLVFRDVFAGADEGPTFNGFKKNGEGPPIDFIFVSPDLSVNRAWVDREPVDGKWPSDHFPVAAVLALPKPASVESEK